MSTERRVLVVGDLMIDVYEEGRVDRVSPEAPVPVLSRVTRRTVLGGAANTAANVRALGAESVLLAVVGEDDSAQLARRLLDEARIAHELAVSETTPTTTKTRFLAGGQQLLRVDREDTTLPDASLRALAEALAERVGECDAVVLSDYDKGVLTPQLARTVVAAARKAGVPVVVDSKKRDLSCFHGCTVIAPNREEARAATGIADPGSAAAAIAATTGGAVLLTLSEEGMLLLDGQERLRLPTRAIEVADVSGAGDTVTAAVAVALAEGASLPAAAEWANAAAAVSVAHRGTFAVPRHRVSGRTSVPAAS